MQNEPLVCAVRKAQRGDAGAFDTLVRRFQDPAVAYARTLLRDPVTAEDATQEAFVQAWRDLPQLLEPAAFGVWLRRLVFKFCDRHRRSTHPTLPLSEGIPLDDDHDPARQAERSEVAGRVHAAIAGLPCALRESTLLYYLTGRDIREVAEFLELPPSTVKNRLHAARKRLRKELWTMVETQVPSEMPSKTPAFAGKVLSQILREFELQEEADAHTADRSLLEEGRAALFATLERSAALEVGTVRDGFTLLWRKRDWPAVSALLMRYLAQPISDSETAWTYAHLANAIALSGNAAGAVLAHEAFERWLPGRSPRLSAWFPFYPVEESEVEGIYEGEEVRLLLLARSAEFTTSYLGVWRNDDYLAKVDTALKEIPVTDRNRNQQFYVLRMACNACIAANDLNRAAEYVSRMHALATGAENATQQAEVRAKALGHAIDLARRRGDDAGFKAGVDALTTLLDDFSKNGSSDLRWVRGQRHELACQLAYADRHDLALPVWEANATTGGQFGGWGWLMHAATVWKVQRDRPRTLALLREARAHDDRDMIPLLEERPEFADVHADPEFRRAVSGQ